MSKTNIVTEKLLFQRIKIKANLSTISFAPVIRLPWQQKQPPGYWICARTFCEHV